MAKRISEQTIVITGATSGIGLATARLACQKGARVFLIARNEAALREVQEQLTSEGGQLGHAAADVAELDQLEEAGRRALERFGHIDTWVNNAGVGIYGQFDQVTMADMRRLFDVTFWGVVHGCRAALPYLRGGGTIVNVGSVESEMALPLHSIYAAAKHAVRGFTEVLRVELRKEGLPIAVSLVKPGSTDTPFFEHAKNYMEAEPRPPPPVYSPELVARVIVRCAEKPVRDVVVGAGGKSLISLRTVSPRLFDALTGGTMFKLQKGGPAGAVRTDILYAPAPHEGEVRGAYDGRVLAHSLYTTARMHPAAALAILAGAAALLAGGTLWARQRLG